MMVVNGILEVAVAVVLWVIDYVFVLCGIIFVIIMIKTLFDVVSKNIEISKPGVQKILGRRR